LPVGLFGSEPGALPSQNQGSHEQLQKLTLTSRAFRNDQLAPFYQEICELTHSHKVLPINSGAEAVESVIKTVRKWGYQVKGVPTDKREIKNPLIQEVRGRGLMIGVEFLPEAGGTRKYCEKLKESGLLCK
jgi:acetylornithine/succinyldiaminopimelate/putrescine aminotransferase